jgi:hypothetical protein
MKLASLPTDLGIRLIGDLIHTRLEDPTHVKECVAAFQRMALASTLEDSIIAMDYWFKVQHKKWSDLEKQKLQVCHDIVQKDVLGLAIESLIQMAAETRGNQKERLAAATILNELYGDKELINTDTLTDRLLVNIGK